jgi:hypothetical protein
MTAQDFTIAAGNDRITVRHEPANTASGAPLFVPPKPRPRTQKESEPRAPRMFKVVDVSTREVLADGAGARETLAVLAGVDSSVDVQVYVWEPKPARWRLLTLAEQRVLWERRDGTRTRRRTGSGRAAASYRNVRS